MVGKALSPTHQFQPSASTSGCRPIVEIGARHQIEPLLQGDLTGLCGLYAAINALRLALADHSPLTRSDCRELFYDGVDFLHRRKGLFVATIDGMGTRRRLALARYLARRISGPYRRVEVIRADHTALRMIDDVFGWIEAGLAQGMPVLVSLTGGLEHYTVVSCSTPRTLGLFDSSGHRFLRKASCGVRSGFHQIPPNGLLRVAVHRSG